MSTFIEKLKIDTGSKKIYLTVVDFVLGDFSEGIFPFTDNLSKTQPIKNLILSNLEQSQIFLGKHYGTTGIEINKLLQDSNTNYIIEIPLGHLQFCNIADIVKLSHTHKIILTDLEEGNSYIFQWTDPKTKQLVKGKLEFFLKSNGLNIDNIFFASPSFTKTNFCREIKFYGFWIILTALCSPFILDIIENNSKEKYIELLKSKNYTTFAVFKNWRARKWRVVLLSLLHHREILPAIDWSLIGESHPVNNNNTKTFDITHFTKFASPEWLASTTYKTYIERFFKSNLHKLPKFLESDKQINIDSVITTKEADFKKYKFSIEVESAAWLSEKAVKSFLLGSMPIIVYPYPQTNYIKQLKNLGFKIIDIGSDNKQSVDDIINCAIEKINSLYNNDDSPNVDDLIANFNLCADKDALSNYISQPLIDTFK
jgi:hypothetical protein